MFGKYCQSECSDVPYSRHTTPLVFSLSFSHFLCFYSNNVTLVLPKSNLEYQQFTCLMSGLLTLYSMNECRLSHNKADCSLVGVIIYSYKTNGQLVHQLIFYKNRTAFHHNRTEWNVTMCYIHCISDKTQLITDKVFVIYLASPFSLILNTN